MTAPKPSTVEEYLANLPVVAQEKLNEIRSILKSVAPDAREELKWGNPVLIGKRILFAYTAYTSHLNFMATGPSMAPFREELNDYKTGKDTIQFPYNKPLPADLIRRIALHRLNDVNENDAKWMY